MSKGGYLMSHDYATVPGVRKAIDEFYADKPETVLQVNESQCVVVSLGGEK